MEAAYEIKTKIEMNYWRIRKNAEEIHEENCRMDFRGTRCLNFIGILKAISNLSKELSKNIAKKSLKELGEICLLLH